MAPYQTAFMFPFMAPYLPTKKVMQKGNAKAGKISIFSPLDAKLGSLAGRVGLKTCSTRLGSG